MTRNDPSSAYTIVTHINSIAKSISDLTHSIKKLKSKVISNQQNEEQRITTIIEKVSKEMAYAEQDTFDEIEMSKKREVCMYFTNRLKYVSEDITKRESREREEYAEKYIKLLDDVKKLKYENDSLKAKLSYYKSQMMCDTIKSKN